MASGATAPPSDVVLHRFCRACRAAAAHRGLLRCFCDVLCVGSTAGFAVFFFSSFLFGEVAGAEAAMAAAATAAAAAATVNGNALSSSSGSSLPMPRSPPKLPDLYGKHRLQAQLQSLNREISFLEDELRALDSLQLASRSCKEVDEFVASNQDPIIPQNRRARKCRLCKRMWSLFVSTQKLILNIPCIVYSLLINSRPSCNISIFCCSSGCSIQLKTPRCSCNISRKCRDCCLCCCWCHYRNCLQTLCCNPCCALPSISCPDCSCSCCKGSFPSCTRICDCASSCLESSCCCLCC